MLIFCDHLSSKHDFVRSAVKSLLLVINVCFNVNIYDFWSQFKPVWVIFIHLVVGRGSNAHIQVGEY